MGCKSCGPSVRLIGSGEAFCPPTPPSLVAYHGLRQCYGIESMLWGRLERGYVVFVLLAPFVRVFRKLV